MANLAILPTPAAIESAWERYRALASALIDHPELAINRAHMEAMARAEQAWKSAFLAQEAAR